MDQIREYVREKNLHFHLNEGMLIVTTTEEKGLEIAKEMLYLVVDQRTVLLLSGGRAPKTLYAQLALDEVINPGAVGQIDERYGKPFHNNSNQQLFEKVGLLRYFQMRDIPFYPILRPQPNSPDREGKGEEMKREQTALAYDTRLRELFSLYPKVVGILGIGLDGHTAGIPADPEVWKEGRLKEKGKTEYVVAYDDQGRFYNERVTLTFLGLSMLDLYLVLVFGGDKKKALEKLLADGSEEEIPSRFYKRPEIAKKTVVVTDQSL